MEFQKLEESIQKLEVEANKKMGLEINQNNDQVLEKWR